MLAIFDRVLADIARQRVDRHRRSRSRALYETLNGHWEKFAPATTAEALRHHYTWRCVARIPATWLARAATEPWLTTKRGKKAAPMDVAIDTPMMRLTRGDDPSGYVYELSESDAASPVVAALSIHRTAPASELVQELASLRNRFGSAVTEANVRPHYAALAALCRPEGSGAGVGDLSTTELRRAFGTGPGLILTSAGWRVSRDVRLGRPIFGAHRPFVSDKGPLARLWRILDISLPSVGDCLTVLEEIADTGTEPSLEDRAVIVDTLRFVAQRP